jgi:hypothetical protein
MVGTRHDVRGHGIGHHLPHEPAVHEQEPVPAHRGVAGGRRASTQSLIAMFAVRESSSHTAKDGSLAGVSGSDGFANVGTGGDPDHRGQIDQAVRG